MGPLTAGMVFIHNLLLDLLLKLQYFFLFTPFVSLKDIFVPTVTFYKENELNSEEKCHLKGRELN